jgi:transcriptional regulator GlxA family with amidase domain
MQRIGFIMFPNFNVLSLSTVAVFETANTVAQERQVAQEQPYELHFLSETGGRIRTSTGLIVETEAFDETVFDTLIVCGTLVVEPFSPGLLAYVKNAPRKARRVASMCTGALVLAEAGLLEGCRVTTHWAYARDLQARFPTLKVEEDRIFIVDGTIWTSAGCTACVDLALAMVEKDVGSEVAKSVARTLVVFHRRAGGQSQHSALLEIEPKSDRIQSALVYAKRNLRTALSVEQLADVAHLSPRQFSRAFHAETGQSPAKAVENLRLEAARLMLEQGRHPVETIAMETGFGDGERMRRAFLRAYGQTPQAIRIASHPLASI